MNIKQQYYDWLDCDEHVLDERNKMTIWLFGVLFDKNVLSNLR